MIMLPVFSSKVHDAPGPLVINVVHTIMLLFRLSVLLLHQLM